MDDVGIQVGSDDPLDSRDGTDMLPAEAGAAFHVGSHPGALRGRRRTPLRATMAGALRVLRRSSGSLVLVPDCQTSITLWEADMGTSASDHADFGHKLREKMN